MYKKQALVEGVRAFSILYHCINTKQYPNVLSSSASVSTFSSMFSSRGVGGHGGGGGGVGKKLGTRSGRKEGRKWLLNTQSTRMVISGSARYGVLVTFNK